MLVLQPLLTKSAMRNLAFLVVLFSSGSLLPGCQKADPAPLTGEVSFVITRPFSIALTTYDLYTEASYGAWVRGPALRKGTFSTHSITSGSEQVTTTFTALNPGNYVFVFSGIALAAQVTPGQLHTFDYHF